MSGARVLMVVDDIELRSDLRASLARQGFEVTVATGVARVVEIAERRLPDVVLLDLDLSGAMDTCCRLRSWSQLPVIVLSRSGDERDKLRAFEAGADDYLTKPLGLEELSARVRVALRHAAGTCIRPEVVLGDGELRIDFGRRGVWRGDKEISLTPREYDVLKFLVRYRDRDVRYWEIFRAVWGARATCDHASFRRYIPRLRDKLEIDPAHPRYLLSNRGSGCRLRS